MVVQERRVLIEEMHFLIFGEPNSIMLRQESRKCSGSTLLRARDDEVRQAVEGEREPRPARQAAEGAGGAVLAAELGTPLQAAGVQQLQKQQAQEQHYEQRSAHWLG